MSYPTRPAERGVIGAAISARPDMGDVVAGMSSLVAVDDFQDLTLGRCWGVICESFRRGAPVDAIAVSVEAKIPVEDLIAMANEVPVATHGTHYARLVAEAGKLKRLAAETAKQAELAAAGRTSSDEAIDSLERLLGELRQRGATTWAPATDGVRSSLDGMDQRGRGEAHGIQTSLEALDRKLGGGLPVPGLTVLAARPGVGKSALAGQVAMRAALAGHPVLFFSLEMAQQQLWDRALCNLGQVDHGLARAGKLTLADWHRLQGAGEKLRAVRWDVDDRARRIGQIASNALRWRLGLPRESRPVIVVDYLQLVRGFGGRGQNREQEVAEVSRSLQGLAAACQASVLALCQLGRQVERDNREPRLSDLRESGALEQDADAVVFLVRDMEQPEGLAELIVAKNRHGGLGRAECHWVGKYQRFDASE